MAKVWNKRHDPVPYDAVYVGRPSKWGNPFRLENEADRDEILEKYKNWLMADAQQPFREKAKRELAGKDLCCWCAPAPCHADILLAVANEP